MLLDLQTQERRTRSHLIKRRIIVQQVYFDNYVDCALGILLSNHQRNAYKVIGYVFVVLEDGTIIKR